MDNEDFAVFERAFRRLASHFRVKLSAVEVKELTSTYFKVLKSFALDAVLLGARSCIETSRTFPLAATWLAAIRSRGSEHGPSDVRQLSVAEVDALELAVAQHYRDAPCGCEACCRAGVDGRPLRFVPMLNGDVEERGYNPRRRRIEVIGGWIHGTELRGYYAAEAAFYAGASRRWPVARLGAGRDREPGEEG